jgi:hypothetical protein
MQATAADTRAFSDRLVVGQAVSEHRQHRDFTPSLTYQKFNIMASFSLEQCPLTLRKQLPTVQWLLFQGIDVKLPPLFHSPTAPISRIQPH